MKFLIKMILIVGIVLFALVNYRYFSFNKGFSKLSMEDKSVTQVLSTLTGVTKVEYYKKTISKDENVYSVYIVTNQDVYLLSATQEEIEGFNILGIFSNNFKPEKITPIPFYVEIVLGLIILLIPFGRKTR